MHHNDQIIHHLMLSILATTFANLNHDEDFININMEAVEVAEALG